ncbi:MAG: hypothetical protein QGF53_13695 [Alphaproteobacteria bacterium]|nr:hypothetical protein [Alphaproteobacteria bacterium]
MKALWALRGAFVAALLAATAPVQAGDQPMLPFEEFVEVSIDRSKWLRYDDSVGRILEPRIERLLRSGDVLGDRVLLKNQVAVYFPNGFIVSSKAEFHTYRPIDGLMPWNVYYRDQIEPNPRYERINEFDRLLGNSCAEVPYFRGRSPQRNGESFARMRINPHGVLSLVLDMPGRYDYLTNEASKSLTVTSAVDSYYLGDPGLVAKLVKDCQRAGVSIRASRR